jgi:hypothetical protein
MQLSTMPHVLLSGLHLLWSHKPFNKCNQQWSFQYKTLKIHLFNQTLHDYNFSRCYKDYTNIWFLFIFYYETQLTTDDQISTFLHLYFHLTIKNSVKQKLPAHKFIKAGKGMEHYVSKVLGLLQHTPTMSHISWSVMNITNDTNGKQYNTFCAQLVSHFV